MKPEKWHLTMEAAAALPIPEGKRSTRAMEHGTMQLLWFVPRGEDIQTPHEQDEIYIVAHGTGVFRRKDERVSFKPGDAIFVAAGEDHRFEEFSDDFATWVVFWGPPGGEGD